MLVFEGVTAGTRKMKVLEDDVPFFKGVMFRFHANFLGEYLKFHVLNPQNEKYLPFSLNLIVFTGASIFEYADLLKLGNSQNHRVVFYTVLKVDGTTPERWISKGP